MVLDGVYAIALYRPVKFFHTKLGKFASSVHRGLAMLSHRYNSTVV